VTVYYHDEFATLHHGDCREILATIERGSVGLLATDPPYGIGYQGMRSKRGPAHDHGPIVGDDGSLDVAPIIEAAARTLAAGRHVYVFGSTAESLAAVECLTAAVDLIWDKGSPGMGDLAALYGPSTEPIAFATYRPSRANREQGRGRLSSRLRRGSVLRVPRMQSKQNDAHPTGKPVALMRQIIESSSMLGDVVLDPFAGSGSTLVAATLAGRRSIGIEIEERYCERAAERLRSARTLRTAMEAA